MEMYKYTEFQTNNNIPCLFLLSIVTLYDYPTKNNYAYLLTFYYVVHKTDIRIGKI